MKIVKKEKFNILVAEEGKKLKNKENTEDEVYYFNEAYIPKTMTLEDCEKKFEEVEDEA